MIQKILITIFAVLLIAATLSAQTRSTCKGVTSKHAACKSPFVDSTGYCRFHNPNRILCAHPGCHNVVPTKGAYCRFHGPAHAVRILKQNTDARGLTCVQFVQDGKTWALDYLTKKELYSLKNL